MREAKGGSEWGIGTSGALSKEHFGSCNLNFLKPSKWLEDVQVITMKSSI